MSAMTARGVLEDVFARNSIDALHNAEEGCSCRRGDLVKCGRGLDEIDRCEPAYERICPCCGSSVFVKAQGITLWPTSQRRL